jgi:hypothetical protein
VGRGQDLIFIGETSSQMFRFARIVVRGAATGASTLVKGLGMRIVVVGLIDLIMIFVLAVILFLLLVVLNRVIRVLLLILLIIPGCYGLRCGSFPRVRLAFLRRVRVVGGNRELLWRPVQVLSCIHLLNQVGTLVVFIIVNIVALGANGLLVIVVLGFQVLVSSILGMQDLLVLIRVIVLGVSRYIREAFGCGVRYLFLLTLGQL